MNRICLVGRVGKDPELKVTPSGVNVATFSLAVNRDFKNAQGERECDWFYVTCWRQTADFVSSYISKGRLVSVTGRMQCRRYEDKNGTTVTAWDVQADAVNGLDKAPEGDRPAAQTADDEPEFADPFSQE